MHIKSKHFMLMLVALLCCALLCGCGSDEPASTAAPAESAAPAVDYSGKLRVSELMIKNRSCLMTAEGAFSDWIELENISGEELSLEAWRLADEEEDNGWSFPAMTLKPGELLLVYADELSSTDEELHANFALSADETLYLYSPDGNIADSLLCPDLGSDVSLALDAEGSPVICNWPSPGFENSAAGYDSHSAGQSTAGPLVINEVTVYTGEDSYDWVEIKNISGENVSLQDYYLSDDHKDYMRWQLPARSLQAGENIVFYCAGEDKDPMDELETNFSLSADRERLFLTLGGQQMVDYISLHDIPLYGSMGRMDGENGFFYFETPTPGYANTGGLRRVTETPTALSADGVFEGTASVTMELDANGSIHYTTDGSYPDAQSPVYSGPVEISETCVVRAVSIEEGAITGRPLTMNYIINEGHSLPVVCLTVDDMQYFNDTYNSMLKDISIPANVAFYEQDGGFKKDCFTSLKGWTSLTLPKKSLGAEFKSVLGGDLEYDVFDNGITTYSDLAIRAGQDYTSAVIRNELFQELALEMGSNMLTQRSKYSVLYINGEYRGLYCLKEDFSKQYYASHAGVTKDSVEFFRAPSGPDIDFYHDVFMFCWHKDLSEKENYDLLCSKVDIDSLIDWFIIEGYSGNTDTQGNLRLFRSPENGNKWTFAFYDIDWGFIGPYNAYTLLINGGANVGGEMPTILWGLLNNAEFKERLVARYAEVYDTVLSDENVLKKIDELAAIVEPEIARDRECWGLETEKWYEEVEALKSFIIDNDYQQFCLDSFCRHVKVSDELKAKYFG